MVVSIIKKLLTPNSHEFQIIHFLNRLNKYMPVGAVIFVIF
jgi:hypothetical protein